MKLTRKLELFSHRAFPFPFLIFLFLFFFFWIIYVYLYVLSRSPTYIILFVFSFLFLLSLSFFFLESNKFRLFKKIFSNDRTRGEKECMTMTYYYLPVTHIRFHPISIKTRFISSTILTRKFSICWNNSDRSFVRDKPRNKVLTISFIFIIVPSHILIKLFVKHY